jgi:putative ABC transport system permease protein
MTGRHQKSARGLRTAGAGPRNTWRGRLGARWRALTGSGSATTVAFGVLASAGVLVALAGPRASAELSTNAFRDQVAQTPAIAKTVIGTDTDSDLSAGFQPGISYAQIQSAQHLLAGRLSALPLDPARTFWSGLATPLLGVTDSAPPVRTGGTPLLELTYRSTLAQNSRLLAGRMPVSTTVSGPVATVQAAVTTATASRYGLRVGSAVAVPNAEIVLRITGIIAARAPDAPFWSYDPLAAAPQLVQPTNGSPYWQGGAFIPASAIIALQTRVDQTEMLVTWMFPLDLGRLTAAQAITLNAALPGRLNTAGGISFTDGQFTVQVSLTTGASSLLATFAADYEAADDVLDLLSVSLAVVGAAVLLLAAWLLADKRRAEFAVLRARGAARSQLMLVALRGSALVVVPGAVAAAALAVALTPGASAPLGWWLAGLTVAVALAGPALITARVHRGYVGDGRPDQPPGRLSSARRLVAEAGLALASIGGLIVLRDQSLGPGGDFYPSAAPILVAIPVAIIVLRVYPLLVRVLLRLAVRRPGATAFLGLARAARVSATAILPAFAMVLALTLVSFAGMVRGAVSRGEVAASWQATGADAAVTTFGQFTGAQQRAVGALPGVRRVAGLGVTIASAGSGGQFNVVTVNPAQYAAYLAATPLAPVPASFGRTAAPGAAVAVLASPGLAAELGTGRVRIDVGLGGEPLTVRIVGLAASLSAVQSVGGNSVAGYLVVPASALGAGAPAPSTLLVAGAGLTSPRLTAAVRVSHAPRPLIVLRSGQLAALQKAPLQHGTYVGLALGGDAAAAGCLLVLLLVLLLSAPAREMTLARMNTMGLTLAQGRRLALIEALPQILAVLIGGIGGALALAPLVGPALSLSVFTGSASSVPVRIEPVWLAGTAVGLLVLAAITLTGQTMVASAGTARSLRIGG